jgi:hypothetical protein
VRDLVLNLPTPDQPGSAMFSSACFKHCTSNVPEFWGVKVNGLSLKDYLVAWLLGEVDVKGQPVAQNIESCTGFGCGACDARRDAPGRAPEPPLPPAHTADLSLSASGGALVRYMPPPPAPPGAPGLLAASRGRGGRRAGPSRDASAPPSALSRSFSGMAVGIGALCAGIACCCCCELIVAARRNYRTPPLPRSDLGGGADEGSGGMCGTRSGGKSEKAGTERRSKGDKSGVKSESARKVTAAWRAARGGVPATEMERTRLVSPPSSASAPPLQPPAPPPRPAPVAPPPRAVLSPPRDAGAAGAAAAPAAPPREAGAGATGAAPAGAEQSKEDRVATRRIERAAMKAATAAAVGLPPPAAAARRA